MVPLTGCKALKDWFQTLYGTFVAANHQTVTALNTPDTPARSGVQVVDSLFL
jgi:hypothetical protein